MVEEHLRLRVDVEELTHKLAIERDLREKQIATYRLKLQVAERDLARLSDPPWYERPGVNRWLGLGLGIVLTVATTFAINQAIDR